MMSFWNQGQTSSVHSNSICNDFCRFPTADTSKSTILSPTWKVCQNNRKISPASINKDFQPSLLSPKEDAIINFMMRPMKTVRIKEKTKKKRAPRWGETKQHNNRPCGTAFRCKESWRFWVSNSPRAPRAEDFKRKRGTTSACVCPLLNNNVL